MASGGAVLLARPRVRLDWSGPQHYDADHRLPCRVCETDTSTRDGQGKPCHQSCAERELAAKLAADRGGQLGELRSEVQLP
ncbi:MAG: hypothetical protein V7603_5025 [Micromonosporaceae bacterium]